MAFDVGTVRTGVARTDAGPVLAVPVTTLRPANDDDLVDQALDLIDEYEPVEIYVGFPRHLSGAAGASAKRARWFAGELAQCTSMAIRLIDERLSTVTAEAVLRDAGRSSLQQRGVVDQVAATVMLDQALETERRTSCPAGELVRSRRKGQRT